MKVHKKGKKWRWVLVSPEFIYFLIALKERFKIDDNPSYKNSYGLDYKPFFVNSQKKPFTPRNIQKFMETVSTQIYLKLADSERLALQKRRTESYLG